MDLTDTLEQVNTLSNRIKTLWRSRPSTPTRMLVWVPDRDVYKIGDGGKFFVVIEDSGTIIRMMDRRGQIYVAIRNRCQDLDGNRKALVCLRADMILCHGESAEDAFVADNIRPLLERET
jgi:hypothetical protein